MLPISMLLSLTATLNAVSGANILALLGTPSRSHHIWNRSLMLALVARGHHVTVLTPDREKTAVPNYTELFMEGTYNYDKEVMNFESMSSDSAITSLLTFFSWGTETCGHGMRTQGFRTLMQAKNTTFDLVIVEVVCSECYLGFVHHFNYPPVMGISAYSSPQWASAILGNPESPAYVPNVLLPLTDTMTFFERLHNTFMHVATTLLRSYYYLPQVDVIAKRHFGETLPPLSELERNISLIMVNTHFSIDFPRPLTPAMVPVGGMHLKPANTLPPDLQKFMDEAKHGVIFFSLGSNVRSDKLGKDKIKSLLDAFKKLPQRILWKWESDTLPGQPANVKLGKWLPQNDILGHPNIKLFITHAGLLSSQEAVYHGVPVVGMPFMADQHINIKKAEIRGVGEKLDYPTLSEESVLRTINKVIGNQSYQDNMKRLSALFRDQPQTPLDRAVYWTEYMIAHKGAPHLRSVAADMPWCQYLLLDVASVLALVAVVAVVAMYLVTRLLLRMVFGWGGKNKVGEKKKKDQGKQQ